jgi:FhuF 2Fe-2S C-terminal domain
MHLVPVSFQPQVQDRRVDGRARRLGGVDSADVALRAAAALGPYFAWERRSGSDVPEKGRGPAGDFPVPGGRAGEYVPAPGRRSGGDWRPLAELSEPEAVADRVGAARVVLAGPPRAVASVTFLGIASRLVSPPFAALVLVGVLPVPDRLWWRSVPRGPMPLAYEVATAAPADATPVAAVLTRTVTPVLHAFADRYRISANVMWGNVASALAGAAGVLADSRPEHAERAGRILEQALTDPPLAGTGTVVRPDPAQARRFLIRRSCCLYYRIPGGGICGDCVLMPHAERRRSWAAALTRSVAPPTSP